MSEERDRRELTGLVLAGGASSRMGRDKALLELDGQPMIEIIVDQMEEICSEVLIVAKDRRRYAGLDAPVILDRFSNVGALAGLHAGLEAASYEISLAVGCDMPFLNPDLLKAFVRWAKGYDVTLLKRGAYVEPLHAAYRRTCLPAMEDVIRAGQRRIISFFPQVRVHYITPAQVAPFDPALRSFRNVNTPEEWQAAKSSWTQKTA